MNSASWEKKQRAVGKAPVAAGVAHREGDVDVIVAQFGRAEALFQVVDEVLLEDRVGGLDGQHLLGTVVQFEPFGEEGAHPEDVLFQEGGDLFEGPGLAADIEGGEEGGREAPAGAVLAQDPEHDPVLFVGVDEEQPAGKTRVHHRRGRGSRIIRPAWRFSLESTSSSRCWMSSFRRADLGGLEALIGLGFVLQLFHLDLQGGDELPLLEDHRHEQGGDEQRVVAFFDRGDVGLDHIPQLVEEQLVALQQEGAAVAVEEGALGPEAHGHGSGVMTHGRTLPSRRVTRSALRNNEA